MTCGDCIPDKRGSGSQDPPVLDPEVEPVLEPEVKPETEQEVHILPRSHLGQHEFALAPYALSAHSAFVLKMSLRCQFVESF